MGEREREKKKPQCRNDGVEMMLSMQRKSTGISRGPALVWAPMVAKRLIR